MKSRKERLRERELKRAKRKQALARKVDKVDAVEAELDVLVQELMAHPEFAPEIRKLCDGLAKTLDEYGKIPYERGDGGEVIILREPRDRSLHDELAAKLISLDAALKDTLTAQFEKSLMDIAIAKRRGSPAKAKRFAESVIERMALAMLRADARPVETELPWIRDKRELHPQLAVTILVTSMMDRLAGVRDLLVERGLSAEGQEAVIARYDAWSKGGLAAQSDPAHRDALKTILEAIEESITQGRALLGLEEESDDEMAFHYEATRNEILSGNRSSTIGGDQGALDEILRSAASPWELPWERDERELGPDIVLDLQLLLVSQQMKRVREHIGRTADAFTGERALTGERVLRSIKEQSERLVNFQNRWLALLQNPKTSSVERNAFYASGKTYLRNIASFVAETRATIGLPAETEAELAAEYEEARQALQAESEKQRKPAGVLREMSSFVHAMHNGEFTPADARAPEWKTRIGFRPAFVGLCHASDDQALMQLGVGLWNDTYRTSDRVSSENEIRKTVGALYAATAPLRRELAISVAEFAALWAHDAFQKVVTTHTYAAALMCTDANADALGDLHLPWRAFMIAIPDGLLAFEGIEGQSVHLRRVLLHVEEDGRAVLIIYDPDMGSGASNILLRCAPNLADLLFDPPIEISNAEGVVKERSAETRAVRMVLRLVTGILVTLLYTQDYRKAKNKLYERGRSREDKRDPEHRITFVGRALKIDCRSEVKRFIAKPTASRDPKAPAVQYMVRGHQKRQVIGVGRTGRKVIWIQPYWKGDPEAPILTKPRLMS